MTDGAAEAILPNAERIPHVAALKHIFELWVMDWDFHDAYLADPERALARAGLDVDPEAVRLLLLRTLPEDASGFIQAGRNRDDSQGTGSTIACVSGFVVNMQDRTVRLVTPVEVSDGHPVLPQ